MSKSMSRVSGVHV